MHSRVGANTASGGSPQAVSMTYTIPAGDGAKHPQRAGKTGADKQPVLAVRVRADSPAALLAIIPHLLGFAPESSLVIIGTEAPRGTVRVTLRYDLPDPPERELAAEIADHAAAVLAAQRLGAATVVGYGPRELVRPLAAVIGGALSLAGIAVSATLRVQGGRYWSDAGGEEAGGPDQGVPFDETGHPASVALTVAGQPVLAGRGAIVAGLAPVGGIAAESMRQATRLAERHVSQILAKVTKSTRVGAARHLIAAQGLAAVSSLIGIYRAGGQYSTDYQLAWLSVTLKDLRVRDDAWARMDPQDRGAHLRLWTDVVRRAQPGYVAGPASLLAFVAWQDGNGALANIALDRALADVSGYSMAILLRQVIAAGTPPAMARLPLTPAEVAACYDDLDKDDLCDEDADAGFCKDGGAAAEAADRHRGDQEARLGE